MPKVQILASAAGQLRMSKTKDVRCAPHVLPPCRVCGEQAKGFHYGVNTCDACKGFFQRSLARRSPYKCVVGDTMERNRAIKTCSHCRYNRCLQAGMSRDAIKIGRYSYEKRSRDVLELHKTNEVTSWRHMTAAAAVADDDDEMTSSVRRLIDVIVTSESQWNLHDVDQYHSQFTDINDNGSVQTIEKDEERLERKTVYVTSSKSEHGICRLLQRQILHVVNLAKRVPGFQLMTHHDQFHLVKRSVWEIWIVMIQRQFFRSLTGITPDLSETLGEELSFQLSTATRRLQTLQLTDAETTILKALILFFTDGMQLDSPLQVEAIQHRLLEALCYLFVRRHRDIPLHLMIGRTMAALTELRAASTAFDSFTANTPLNAFEFFL